MVSLVSAENWPVAAKVKYIDCTFWNPTHPNLHVGAVTGLGHRETADHVEVDESANVLLVVALGAEVQDRGREQAPLHARLDLHRRVGQHELLEGGDVAAVVLASAEGLREGAVHRILLDQLMQLAEQYNV